MLCGLLFLLLSLCTLKSAAEGSKDLYPAGAIGNRAFLYANTDNVNFTDRYPFKTKGAHFVYAKANETIAVASSALGINNGQIIVTSPNGTIVTYNVATGGVGRISSRTAELAGPLGAGGYTPITVVVTAANEGVWKVEFVAPVGNGNSSDITAPDISANANWTQATGNTANYIAAWDVSVRNSENSGWLKGRVYTNVLNLGINNNFTSSAKGFNVTNYILTEDGRAYRVKTNGNNGWAFTFFSNNNGFAVNGVATYKSLDASTQDALAGLHDPRTPDDALNKTHKIFYNQPNADLPPIGAAYITAANQTTWLKKIAVLPIITDLKFTGVEGTDSKISYKGAKISFTASSSGSYQITIPIANSASRVINGSAAQGYNEIFWDVKDGNGNLVPPGPITPLVQTFLRSAEVHFPYIDMEINPQGIIIELIENNTSYNVNPANTNPAEYSDIVYWDDVNITNAGVAGRNSSNPVTNLTGVSSNTNGHKFGAYSTANQFGDSRSMDTWTYIESGKTTQLVNIEILKADLKIESVNPDLAKYFSDRTITYTVRVQNDGPSAANGSNLSIAVPAGLTIGLVTTANASVGVTVNNGITTAQGYTALLDLPNQAVIDFIVVATFTGSYDQTFSNTKASILRPADLTDPDATGNNASGPVNADEECLNGASSGIGLCNNIKYNTVNGQEVCQGNNIVPVSYPLSADGTQFENSTLPTALSLQDASGNRTISGSLSSAGIQTFYIKTLNTKRTQTNVIIRANTLPDATANGPLSVCVDANDNPAISFIGSGALGAYEFSYTVNNGTVQTITTSSNSATATVVIPLSSTGTFTYQLLSVKDLTTNCSQAKNLAVTVNILPKPNKAHIQLNN
ncbi:hypothetical protein SAMN05421827_101523 [Pedobacter terrae]|uniref:DUF11 domain-containing protein n=1 Tax=Pedobacter terrae TaxID=405671 RepID=A0A1G7NW14_9SPHI|nr:DUF11 domain-containing protein [Pedobacter terrae]SDF78077.1 hypothetical protein SAMN05421827_101523 [Pedobacter terrae]